MKTYLLVGALLALVAAAGWLLTGPALSNFALVLAETAEESGPGFKSLGTLNLTVLCGTLLLAGCLVVAIGLAKSMGGFRLNVVGRVLIAVSGIAVVLGGGSIFSSVRQSYEVLTALATAQDAEVLSIDTLMEGIKGPSRYQSIAAGLLLVASGLVALVGPMGIRLGESRAENVGALVLRVTIGCVVVIGALAIGVWLTMLPNAWTLQTLLTDPPAQGISPSDIANQILAIYNKSLFFASALSLTGVSIIVASFLIAKPAPAR